MKAVPGDQKRNIFSFIEAATYPLIKGMLKDVDFDVFFLFK